MTVGLIVDTKKNVPAVMIIIMMIAMRVKKNVSLKGYKQSIPK